MSEVIFFDKNNKRIGLKVRSVTSGPEAELLQEFVEKISKQYQKNKSQYAIFIEPKLATGFPDAVIAEYKEENLKNWNPARCLLSETDIKLLYYLLFFKRATKERIYTQTGISPSGLLGALERLMDAELVIREKGQWAVARDISQKMALHNLVAIEAKISNWNKVFEQAQSNFCFAKESYVLTPIKSPSEKIRERAHEIGVGIYALSPQKVLKITPPKRINSWGSYTSLLFNEWLGRYAFLN